MKLFILTTRMSARALFLIAAISLIFYPIATNSSFIVSLVYIPSLLLALCTLSIISELLFDKLTLAFAARTNNRRCPFGLNYCCLHGN